jgi:uncharacterized protein with HEPN domain
MFDIDKVDRGTELFILDIYIAILKIKKVASKFDNVQNLLHSFTDWDSVIREFEIIGEASKYLIRDKLITKDYQIIVDFRNQISHGYFGIDQEVVWAVIHTDLKDFENIIIELINKLEQKQELIDSFIEDSKYLDFVVQALEALNADS